MRSLYIICALLLCCSVQVVSAEMGYAYITQWGSPGSEDGQFNGPSGVAVDSAGNAYVVDSGNDQIQKFTSTGTLITKRGSRGSEGGQFDWPGDVTVDSAGNVYVADTYNNRIQKFALVTPVLPSGNTPRGLTGDGLYEDINGNGALDFNDVVLFFNGMDWVAENEPIGAFDFNRNGQIDFNDIVVLFNQV